MEFLIAILVACITWFAVDSTVIHPKPPAIHYYDPASGQPKNIADQEAPKTNIEENPEKWALLNKAIRIRDEYILEMVRQGHEDYKNITPAQKEYLTQYFLRMVEEEEKRVNAFVPTQNVKN